MFIVINIAYYWRKGFAFICLSAIIKEVLNMRVSIKKGCGIIILFIYKVIQELINEI